MSKYILHSDYTSSLTELDGHRTIKESFKILQFSNFGFVAPAENTQLSVTINIKQEENLLDSVTLVFLLEAGASTLELSDVSSTADDEVPRRNIVLPRVFALDKAKLADAFFDPVANTVIAAQHLESVSGLSQENAARLGNDFIESGYDGYNDYYGVNDKRTKLLVSLHAYTVTSTGYDLVCNGYYQKSSVRHLCARRWICL